MNTNIKWKKIAKIAYFSLLALVLIVSVALALYTTSENQEDKKTKDYPEVTVMNEGLDPNNESQKEALDKYQITLIKPDVLQAKIKIRELEGTVSAEEGTDFIIYDFRKKGDYDINKLPFSMNVTPKSFLEDLATQDPNQIIILVGYNERDEDVNWAARACLIMGYFGPYGIEGGYPADA